MLCVLHACTDVEESSWTMRRNYVNRASRHLLPRRQPIEKGPRTFLGICRAFEHERVAVFLLSCLRITQIRKTLSRTSVTESPPNCHIHTGLINNFSPPKKINKSVCRRSRTLRIQSLGPERVERGRVSCMASERASERESMKFVQFTRGPRPTF